MTEIFLIVKILIKVTSLAPGYKLDMIIVSYRECEHFIVCLRNWMRNQGRRSLWDRGTCPPNIYEGGHPW